MSSLKQNISPTYSDIFESLLNNASMVGLWIVLVLLQRLCVLAQLCRLE